jgi:hypothetical protein
MSALRLRDDRCRRAVRHGFENDSDTTEVECGRCEREFEVTLHVSFSYTTKCPPQP